jgi:predicted RNase H-like nuclease
VSPKPSGAQRGPQLPYKLLAGVEPCPAGWLVAAAKLVGTNLALDEPFVTTSFRELLDNIPAYTAIAAHVPIGLPSRATRGGRKCDREARKLLGWPRQAAIMSAPSRRTLGATSYENAAARNGGHLGIITWRLLPKITEVAGVVEPYHQRMLYEVQPELVFYHLNEDTPLQYSKHTQKGVDEREEILRRRVPAASRVLDARLKRVRKPHLVDACADLWGARLAAGRGAARLPEDPEWNDEGIRMEIIR